ncbi:MAG TPA: cohesin domain-containing protein [Candidatus Bathyarchaeia archaeon]|nr:cohesin domain-containing protein [Candidatus Bathyarchaeia archaeon]
MSLTGNHRLRLVILAALMITFALPAALYSSSLAGNHSLNDKTPVRTPQAGFSGFATLGFDCGYGSNEAPANATGIASPDGATNTGNAGNPTFDSQCTWAGSADIPLGGTQLQPLVSDNPSLATCGCFAPSRGGGFTAEIVFIQNSTTLINGFDITVSWDPKILQFVEFDQGGLPWFGGNSFTATNIFDNGLGSAELSQAILSPPAPLALLAGNQTLFRMRFDVVGIGRTALKISNDQIIDANLTPNNVHHITRQSNFQSSNIPDLVAGITLGYNASWTFTPNPEVPGSPLTLLAATATCPGCTGPLTYKWDTDSVQG